MNSDFLKSEKCNRAEIENHYFFSHVCFSVFHTYTNTDEFSSASFVSHTVRVIVWEPPQLDLQRCSLPRTLVEHSQDFRSRERMRAEHTAAVRPATSRKRRFPVCETVLTPREAERWGVNRQHGMLQRLVCGSGSGREVRRQSHLLQPLVGTRRP